MISLHSPVTIALTLGAITEITVASVLGPWVTYAFFVSPGHPFLLDPLDYLRSVSYIFGHVSWEHCIGNVMLLLILGPLLEEKYGSMALALMILITAFGSALICSFLGLGGLGASGIVFMFIVMSSFGRTQGFKIPLTMLMVVFLYMGGEIVAGFRPNPGNVGHFAHLLGGGFGLMWGLIYHCLPDDTTPLEKLAKLRREMTGVK